MMELLFGICSMTFVLLLMTIVFRLETWPIAISRNSKVLAIRKIICFDIIKEKLAFFNVTSPLLPTNNHRIDKIA